MSESKSDLTTPQGMIDEINARADETAYKRYDGAHYGLDELRRIRDEEMMGMLAELYKRLDALEDEKTVFVCLRCDTGTPHVRITAVDDVDWRCGCCGLVSRRSP